MALQTDKDHFGKGYASLVLREMSKKVAELGHDINAGIFDVNTPSRTLFGKLGFKVLGNIHWICTKITWNDADE